MPDFCALWRAFIAVAGDRWREVAGVHRTCPVNYSGANSRSWRVPETLFLGAPDNVRYTPDSPVNYSGAPLEIPEGEEFSLESPGTPDTVRWHTRQSGAPDQGAFGCPLLSCLNPFLGLFIGLM